ncbi:arrestin domain-containing protein 3-like isoform X3 [Columba livia]|uniref:arrestin domain-containing protein 3-like isoform X3 n=1 Tax=Columba livia TaxID=8932 RepID=UPI0031BBB539
MVLGKVKSLTISFDCLNGSNILVYSSGDTVSGRVSLEVTGETRVKSLKIHARGYAKVRWTESRNAGSNTAYTQNYTEEVEYFNHKDVLLGHEREGTGWNPSYQNDWNQTGASFLLWNSILSFSLLDDDNSEAGLHTIHSGRHEYAFSFELPQIPLATSFEGRHGGVRYWVKAELHRPWLLPVKLKKEFTVFEHIDINTPSLLSPQAGTKEKTLCCWLCTSGPISLSAKIERKGYTPGESIQIFAEIENCSSRMVVPKATIYQTQAFYAKGKMKQVKQVVANLCGESLSAGKTETWNGKQLKIPPVSPSILDCSIIRVEYSLTVYVDIPGAMDLFLNLPLVVGTIPLHPFGSRTSSVSSQRSMNVNWLGLTLPERPEDWKHWGVDYPGCVGTTQQPINIDTARTMFSPQLWLIQLSGFSLPANELKLRNSGHTVVLELPESLAITSGYTQQYQAMQLYLHWGSLSGPSLEHTINRCHFAVESTLARAIRRRECQGTLGAGDVWRLQGHPQPVWGVQRSFWNAYSQI